MSQTSTSPSAAAMPDAAAGSILILWSMTSMRRLPSLDITVRSQAASPAKLTLRAADNGSSDPTRSESRITCLGVGFHSGVCVSLMVPPAPYCASQVRVLSPTTIDNDPPLGWTPCAVQLPQARFGPP